MNEAYRLLALIAQLELEKLGGPAEIWERQDALELELLSLFHLMDERSRASRSYHLSARGKYHLEEEVKRAIDQG